MNTLDLEVFGEDERRIRKSNVRHIFTPHKPITDERFFRGRYLLSTLLESMHYYMVIEV